MCQTDGQTDGHTPTAYIALAERRAVKRTPMTILDYYLPNRYSI